MHLHAGEKFLGTTLLEIFEILIRMFNNSNTFHFNEPSWTTYWSEEHHLRGLRQLLCKNVAYGGVVGNIAKIDENLCEVGQYVYPSMRTISLGANITF